MGSNAIRINRKELVPNGIMWFIKRTTVAILNEISMIKAPVFLVLLGSKKMPPINCTNPKIITEGSDQPAFLKSVFSASIPNSLTRAVDRLSKISSVKFILSRIFIRLISKLVIKADHKG